MRRVATRAARTFLLLLAALIVFLPPVFAAAHVSDAASPEDLAKKVDAHYDHLHSLRVQFTETYQGMGMRRTESGTLLLAKPGRMKWLYSNPAGKVFVIGGKNAYSYTPGDAQAERYPAKQLEDFRSPLRFLLGHAQIEKDLAGLTVTPAGSDYKLRGVPKGMDQRVSEVTLTVTPEGMIRAIDWQETDGATTQFRLEDEQPNPRIMPDSFSFRAPEGVVVVRGMTPM